MNTGKVHVRFWNAMTERYGRRWTEQYGPEASASWRDLVNKFTLDDIKAALAALGQAAPDFPPTLPQFETILAKVANAKKADTTNWIRGYWRSAIVHNMCMALNDRKLCEPMLDERMTFDSFEQLLIANRRILGPQLVNLLDQLEGSERRMSQRTSGLEELCAVTCRRISRIFRTGGLAEERITGEA